MVEQNPTQIINVEVAYALPDRQQIVPVKVEAGTTVYEAAVQSGIAELFPDIDLEQVKMGIFGKTVPKPRDQAIQAGERVELYRPLIADPKASRAKRAAKAKQAKAETKSENSEKTE